MSSGGLGGLNPSPHGVVIGVVQLQLPTVKTKEDLAAQTDKIAAMVGKARRNLSGRDRERGGRGGKETLRTCAHHTRAHHAFA